MISVEIPKRFAFFRTIISVLEIFQYFQLLVLLVHTFQQGSFQNGVKSIRIHWNSRNRSIFERAQLPDGFEFGGVQTFYRYLLPELHPFPGSIRHWNRRTQPEIAGEVAFETGFGTSGDVHRPTLRYSETNSSQRTATRNIRVPRSGTRGEMPEWWVLYCSDRVPANFLFS